ncbi:hypothetical protein SEUCBS140593_009360 [Sporothrix eucalyptigena]|uniref:Major facilitator superfamily (MFS) profile domain-containing protein n=1 Tax=Sporothrix eucalyptigena TaxID=1812306 RepID=A0ABP0CX03_9PEZI
MTDTPSQPAGSLNEKAVNIIDTSNEKVGAYDDATDAQAHGTSKKVLVEIPRAEKWILWIGVLLIAYANGLDNFTMSVYLQTAASQFNGITQYTTIAVIQSMLLGVLKPFWARFADLFGRAAGYGLSILLFTVGVIIMAASQSIKDLSAGIVFFAIGSTGVSLCQDLVLADLVSARWRPTVGALLTVHFIINFGVSSKITGALVPNNWRWGVGMFTIINPLVTLPVVIVLGRQQWRAYKAGVLAPYPYRGMSVGGAFMTFAKEIDAIGLFLVSAGFLFVLLPLTIASAAPHGFQTGYIIAMFVLGGIFLVIFPIVELYVSPMPMVNIRKLATNASVLIPAGIVFVDQFSYGLTLTPVYQWSRIMFDFNVTNATYFMYTQSLCLVVFNIVAGFICTMTGRYKWVTFFGAVVRFVGLGLMIRYREAGSSIAQAVVPQVIQGIGGGFMTASTQVVAQAAVSHDEVAIVTGFYLLVLEVGSSIGSAVVGAVQKQLRGELMTDLAGIANTTVIETIYSEGATAAVEYPMGSAIRSGIIKAWSSNMHSLLIGAIIIAAFDVILAFFLPDKILPDTQNFSDDEAAETPVPMAMRKTE